jgi:hypothetical protein
MDCLRKLIFGYGPSFGKPCASPIHVIRYGVIIKTYSQQIFQGHRRFIGLIDHHPFFMKLNRTNWGNRRWEIGFLTFILGTRMTHWRRNNSCANDVWIINRIDHSLSHKPPSSRKNSPFKMSRFAFHDSKRRKPGGYRINPHTHRKSMKRVTGFFIRTIFD